MDKLPIEQVETKDLKYMYEDKCKYEASPNERATNSG